MGKKEKKEEIIQGLPAWMGTFSDLVTLLLTFFIMMMAMANFEDTKRVETVVGSIHEAFGVDSFEDVMLLNTNAKNMTESRVSEDTIHPIVVRLRQAMSQHVSDDMLQITQRESEIRVRLDDRVLFAPGSVELQPGAYALLADVGRVAVEDDVDVKVEGHTDATGSELDNWTLSSQRAVAVVMALRERGPVPGNRVEASAMGAFRPATVVGEDQAWNRRIELVLRTNQLGAKHAVEALGHGVE